MGIEGPLQVGIQASILVDLTQVDTAVLSLVEEIYEVDLAEHCYVEKHVEGGEDDSFLDLACIFSIFDNFFPLFGHFNWPPKFINLNIAIYH